MPRFDQTGPAGYGPGTGRGMGPCGRGMAFGRGFCRGFGRGRGFGMGFGPGFYGNYSEPEPLSKDAQKQLLEAELKRIEAEKTEIQRRLTTLE
jgi:Family of unknown function (DUF5320)